MARKKTWSELTGCEKWRMFVLGTAQVALQFVALRDLSERPQSEVRGPKAAWVAGSFANFVGPLAYLAFGRLKK
ncbi:PLDc N-terminal domain-containing protein [Zhihengliuella salsuginis]|uniref:Cardiolipin synthase N-terminal domain-containing protein n=1 Tax=Zhihengliuella salsuginis TaxID=578222 RepID=A0ABQ3GC77_9MICC|nr:PLD nuclease N-terminal domain-containing protein [Zhihengliuella salsuginis]GHD00116.1 hypothetical protein GCM10008096_03010 [Zhihengliuella salsuginis]